MVQESFINKLDISFFVVCICMIIVAVIYFLGFQLPNILLLMLGVSAIIVGIMKIVTGILGVKNEP